MSTGRTKKGRCPRRASFRHACCAPSSGWWLPRAASAWCMSAP